MKLLRLFARRSSILPCFLALLAILSGCLDNKPIKIAFIGAVSGNYSKVGTSVRNAVLMKIDSVNQAGGINGRNCDVKGHYGLVQVRDNQFKYLDF
jgi:branched-chain amino acid transport system substrate-binding protein